MAEVQVIPPKAVRPDTLRVAAYCRVSSDSADQLHSYAAQIRAYTQAINAHDGWDLVDIYADEGLTGTRMDKREDFNRLMADCRKGKIDKIVVKSISRFARNTRDCLATLRELSALGVTVKFEKENIDTGTLTSELMVSVSASLAQEESISISKNQRMSYQRRMERGEFITCSAPFGYQIVDGKNLAIVEDQAEIVKWIFAAYLKGYSSEWIARELSENGPAPLHGGQIWHQQTIRKMLTNEKYIGDALCQKCCQTRLLRTGGPIEHTGNVHLKCSACRNTFVVRKEELLAQTARQLAAHETPVCKPYAPSAEAVRLANAINRALEQPGDGKEALSHILQGAAARYACCDDGVDTAVSQTQPDQIDWERFERMVSHIIIGTDNAITVHF